MNKKNRPIVLAILDGWGVGKKDSKINAIEASRIPFFNKARSEFPFAELSASGEAVGLEKNQMSGSETGHLNIGAGRVVKQDVRIILEEISCGRFFQNPVFLSTVDKVKKNGGDIHLMGLMGNNDSPHSHPDVFLALLVLMRKMKMDGKIFVHLFTDGRDSFPESAREHWEKWKGMMNRVGIGDLASVVGRFYAMDRVKNWDRLTKAYDAMVLGKGEKFSNFEKVVEYNYQKGNTDEYFEPSMIVDEKKEPLALIKDGDGVIFFNLRSDRARQFSKFFVGKNNEQEKYFPKIEKIKNLSFTAMTSFGPDLDLKTAYLDDPLRYTLPAVLSKRKQLYISETEKYSHITYFINGGYPDAIGGEERIVVESPKVRSYDQTPEMSADKIARLVSAGISNEKYDFVALNFANADMVGHTGNFNATIKAVECLDKNLEKIYLELKKKNGILVITADHGNADEMVDEESGRPFTFHTKNPVPFIMASESEDIRKIKLKKGGKLANITPTLLDLMDLYKPDEMLGESLIS